jgi:hypothetical protein
MNLALLRRDFFMPGGRPDRNQSPTRQTHHRLHNPQAFRVKGAKRLAADAATKLVQALPRGVLRDFDRERPEICGARAPSFFVWFFFRLCRSPLAFDASLFVNCCEFHHGDSMRCPPLVNVGLR